ncbi:MAG: hypothetical protein H6858_00210 [Rhodospirillales bacterium]|nr:hypothetical protein [Rhodospirillales bacterium]
MNMEKLLFERPKGKSPKKQIKVTKPPAIGFLIFILFLFLIGPFIVKEEQSYLKILSEVFAIALLVWFLRIFLFIKYNPEILEVFDLGIWLPINRIFIPKSKLIRIFIQSGRVRFTYRSILFRSILLAKVQRIALEVSLTPSEIKNLPVWLLWRSKKVKNPDGSYNMILVIPFTTGSHEDIGLNCTRSELLSYLQSYKDDRV